MGWTGALVGSYLGSRLLGALGALLGAAIGSYVEEKFTGSSSGKQQNKRVRTERGPSSRPSDEMVFCASAAAMLAKMAKADGVITQSEINVVEGVFSRLGFSASSRNYAIDVFRRAKDDAHTIYEYASDFASVVGDVETRELFYGLLWELAAADGFVSPEEEKILRSITRYLAIPSHFYTIYSRQYGTSRSSSSRGGGARSERGDSLREAYETLGVSQNATDDELKKAYREKAKQLHPDRLRAQGLPDGMIKKANERMAAVNDAWAQIKSARGIK